jgi:hypothetical protein
LSADSLQFATLLLSELALQFFYWVAWFILSSIIKIGFLITSPAFKLLLDINFSKNLDLLS